MSTVRFKRREEWLAWRRGGIGSSDAPSILRPLLPSDTPHIWGTPTTVWQSKLIDVPDVDSDVLLLGRHLERGIGAAFEERTKIRIEFVNDTLSYIDDHEPVLRATPDAISRGGVVEIKHTSHRYTQDDACPVAWQIQVQHQMMVTRTSTAIVICASGAQRLVSWEVQEDLDWRRNWRAYATAWWERHVVGGAPPDADETEETGVALRRHWQPDGSEIVLGPEAADWIVAAETARREAALHEPAARLAKARIMAAMGEAETAIVIGFAKPITWRTTKSGGRQLRLPTQ